MTTPAPSERAMPEPPEGYETWLDYAIEHIEGGFHDDGLGGIRSSTEVKLIARAELAARRALTGEKES